jgi:hypothetical protein
MEVKVVLGTVLALLLQASDGGQSFAAGLRDRTRRDKVVCDAYRRDRLLVDSDACEPVLTVVEAAGPKGIAFAIFTAVSFLDAGQGEPLGHFEVYDSRGRHIAWFENNNVLTEVDSLVRLTSGGVLIAQEMWVGAGCSSSDGGVELVLKVISVVPVAVSSEPILVAIAGPPGTQAAEWQSWDSSQECRGNTCSETVRSGSIPADPDWQWAVGCDGGSCSLEIGPTRSSPVAAWMWSAKSLSATGPPGQLDGGFYRSTQQSLWRDVERFAAEHGLVGCSR